MVLQNGPLSFLLFISLDSSSAYPQLMFRAQFFLGFVPAVVPLWHASIAMLFSNRLEAGTICALFRRSCHESLELLCLLQLVVLNAKSANLPSRDR